MVGSLKVQKVCVHVENIRIRNVWLIASCFSRYTAAKKTDAYRPSLMGHSILHSDLVGDSLSSIVSTHGRNVTLRLDLTGSMGE